jgi:4-amino-4-deoxy-L-arabinose transferase-like glycosyltransferase
MYGMFDDGMFYSCIARNLVYDAQATIWDLKVSNALDAAFNGHPPFNFWVQALFFKLLGDVYWVERVYSLFLAGCSMGLLVACWRLFQREGARLAVLFWLSVPIVGWSFGNNLLENLLTVLTAGAVYSLVAAAQQERPKWYWVVLATGFLCAAVLTKGPVGLFPLAVPFGYALLVDKKRWKDAIGTTLILVIGLLGGYFLLTTLSPRADAFLGRYWELQLVGSLTGQDSLTPHRFYVLQALIEEFLPALLVGLVLQGFVFYLKLTTAQIPKQQVLFLLWIAVCASFPLLISPKQLRFYIVPSMFWYALAWGLACWPALVALMAYSKDWVRRQQLAKGILGVGVLVCLGLGYQNAGKNAREKELLADVRKVGALAERYSTIYISPSLYPKWSLHAYFYRYYYIDLNTVFQEQTYMLAPKQEDFDRSGYRRSSLELEVLQLYERVWE